MSDAAPEIRKLYARPGEPVTATKWNALLHFVESLLNALSEIIGPGLLKDEYGLGFYLRAEQQASSSFVGAFYVSGGVDAITVGMGTADGQIPTLKGKLIDGSETDGEIPTLKPDEPNQDLRSWVCLEAYADLETKLLREELPLIITHRNDLVPEETSGLRVLAMLVWSDLKTISAIHQVVYFHQRVTISESASKLIIRISADA